MYSSTHKIKCVAVLYFHTFFQHKLAVFFLLNIEFENVTLFFLNQQPTSFMKSNFLIL